VGSAALRFNIIGTHNTAVGESSLDFSTGSSNSALGAGCRTDGNSGCVLLGRNARATADNQFVVGSTTTNAGTVTTEANTSTKVWNVKINGVDYKILLA
jgi:hypothetical protein